MSRFYHPGQKPWRLLSRRPNPGSKTGTNSPLEPGQMARSVVVGTTHMVVYCSLTLNHTMKFEAFMIFFLLQVSQTKKNLMPVFFIRKHQNKVMCSYSGKVRCLCFCQKDNLMSGCDAKIAINSVAVTSLGRCYIATPWPSLFAQTHGT